MARTRKGRSNNGSNRRFATQQSLDGYIKGICDIMRRSNCAGALQYVPELTWILFLRILDEREDARGRDGRGGGRRVHALARSALPLAGLGRARRRQAHRAADGHPGRLLRLRQRRPAAPPARACATGPTPPRARRSSARSCPASSAPASTPSATSSTCSTRSTRSAHETVDTTHIFTLSQVYEGLLLKMGEKGNDGGQFFTPREIIRAMVRVDRPPARRDGLRPRLRHRRLPRPVLRAHGRRRATTTSPRRPARDAQAAHLLRPREGQR